MTSILYRLCILIGLLLSNVALAAQCVPPTVQCLDTTPCKTISGVTACLSTATLPAGATRLSRDCWDIKNTYNCDTLQVDTCTPLQAAGCTQTASSCAQTDVNGNCQLYDKTFTCVSQVATSASTCTGLPVGCVLKSSSCMTVSAAGTAMAGQCTATSNTYECPAPSTTSTTITDCGSQTYCQGTLCTQAGNKPNTDFGQVVAQMEAARQAAKYYDPATARVFAGHNDRCAIQLWGAGLAGDCCKLAGGAQSNNQIAEQIIGSGIQQSFAAAGITVTNPSAAGSVLNQVVSAGSSAVGTYATNAYNAASSYVYDVFYPTAKPLTDGIIGGVQNLVGVQNAANVATQSAAPIIDKSIQAAGTSPSSSFSSFSYYGFTVSTGAPAAGAFSLGSMGGFNFTFDPWSFAAAVALQVIMEALQCTEPEKKLMQMRGAKLCHAVGSYCSNQVDVLFATVCMEESQAFCCYNSKLAKIINEQGRPQIPKGWGTPQSPDCAGFTMDEMKMLDFSKMDLAEFIADVTAKLPNPTQLQNGIQKKATLMYSNAPPF